MLAGKQAQAYEEETLSYRGTFEAQMHLAQLKIQRTESL